MVREIIRRQRHDGSPGKQPDPGRGKLCSFCCDWNAGGGRIVTDSLENKKAHWSTFPFAHMIPGNYSGHGTDGIFLYAEPALRMLTLLIGHTVFCIPYILMEVKARLVGLDPSLEEAARDLGATSMRAFLTLRCH